MIAAPPGALPGEQLGATRMRRGQRREDLIAGQKVW
jgi:hypothetical protein